MFDELLRHPGVEEIVELRSPFGFMAFHGGSLEEVTDVVATMAADRAGASLYAVLQPPDLRWHIPSTMVVPESSAGLAEFLDHVDVVVAVHGYGREGMWTSVLLGGGNRALAEHVAACLRPRLPDYTMLTDLADIPRNLRGLHPDNPVNRVRGGGVQLELPPRIRGKSPIWRDWTGPGLVPHTEALIDGLADAARSWAAPGAH
jgi:phage replication-related protein YjqB (UPF0714/DUF867 family)